jgi:hypothetical protein
MLGFAAAAGTGLLAGAAASMLRPFSAAAKLAPPPAAPQPPAGLTVREATDSFQSDLNQLSDLRSDLTELTSCLAVEPPADCVPDWRQLQARLAAAAAACGRLRASAPVVGAAVAERGPAARGGGLLGGLAGFGGGRQISPADLEFLEQVEEAAVKLDDRLLEARAALSEAAASFDRFDRGAVAAVGAVGAVVAAARGMLAGGGAGAAAGR